MSWSSEDFKARLEKLFEKCSDQVLHEMEAEILSHLRDKSRVIIDDILYRDLREVNENAFEFAKSEASNNFSEQKLEDTNQEEQMSNSNSNSRRIFYGFCIMPKGKYNFLPLTGLDDASCSIISHDELSMVICTLPYKEYNEEALHRHMQDLQWIEEHAKKHEEVLLQIMNETPIIPLPFCTIFIEENSIIKQLSDQKLLLKQELAKVVNLFEMSTKLFVRLDILHKQLKTNLSLQEGGSNYFRRLHQEKQQEKEIDSIIESYGENLLRVLRNISADNIFLERDSIEAPEGMVLVFAAYFLVSEENKRLWEQALIDFDENADEWGFFIDISGPLPPYHFTKLKED